MKTERLFLALLATLVSIFAIIGIVAIILGVTSNPAPYGVG